MLLLNLDFWNSPDGIEQVFAVGRTYSESLSKDGADRQWYIVSVNYACLCVHREGRNIICWGCRHGTANITSPEIGL
jgi:hypothetical protein